MCTRAAGEDKPSLLDYEEWSVLYVSRNNIFISIENNEEIMEALGATEAQMKKAVKRTVSDLKQRVPGWISEKVMEEYNIKKKDIMETLKSKNRETIVETSGVRIDGLNLVYEGRLLTPIHFDMKPGRPYRHNKKYTVSVEIIKGNRVTLGTNRVFLKSIGINEKTNKEKFLPFQRREKAKYPVDVIKTVSVPQMITNSKVKDEIQKKVNKEAMKRLKHNILNSIHNE